MDRSLTSQLQQYGGSICHEIPSTAGRTVSAHHNRVEGGTYIINRPVVAIPTAACVAGERTGWMDGWTMERDLLCFASSPGARRHRAARIARARKLWLAAIAVEYLNLGGDLLPNSLFFFFPNSVSNGLRSILWVLFIIDMWTQG